MGGVTCKIVPPPLLSIGWSSKGHDWSFHSLHRVVGFHSIRSPKLVPVNFIFFEGPSKLHWQNKTRWALAKWEMLMSSYLFG